MRVWIYMLVYFTLEITRSLPLPYARCNLQWQMLWNDMLCIFVVPIAFNQNQTSAMMVSNVCIRAFSPRFQLRSSILSLLAQCENNSPG